jgi:hypothetical protein
LGGRAEELESGGGKPKTFPRRGRMGELPKKNNKKAK